MEKEIRDVLNEYYKKDNDKLSQLINKNLNHWV